MAPPLGSWPAFNVLGKLTDTEGNPFVFRPNLVGAMGEEALTIQFGLRKLFAVAASGPGQSRIYLSTKSVTSNPVNGWLPVLTGAVPQIAPGGGETSPDLFHVDTPGPCVHEGSGLNLCYHTQSPGTSALHFPGVALDPGKPIETELSIGVATRSFGQAPIPGDPWSQNHQTFIEAQDTWERGFIEPATGRPRGGLSECTGVWMPSLSVVRVWYRGLSASNPSVGSTWRWCYSWADTADGITNPQKRGGNPPLDPFASGNPLYVMHQASGHAGPWQASFTWDARANGVHCVLMVPPVVPGGGRIGHLFSADGGNTWEANPNFPPGGGESSYAAVMVPGQSALGVPAGGYYRTPHLLINESTSPPQYELYANAVDDITSSPPIGGKHYTYVATATRPSIPSPSVVTGSWVAKQ